MHSGAADPQRHTLEVYTRSRDRDGSRVSKCGFAAESRPLRGRLGPAVLLRARASVGAGRSGAGVASSVRSQASRRLAAGSAAAAVLPPQAAVRLRLSQASTMGGPRVSSQNGLTHAAGKRGHAALLRRSRPRSRFLGEPTVANYPTSPLAAARAAARRSSPQLATARHSPPQLATARHSPPQPATARHSTARHQLATARHSSPQLATARHSTRRLASSCNSMRQCDARCMNVRSFESCCDFA